MTLVFLKDGGSGVRKAKAYWFEERTGFVAWLGNESHLPSIFLRPLVEKSRFSQQIIPNVISTRVL